MKDIAMHIIDIFQNSIRAKATEIGLEINEDTMANRMTIIFSDNGVGMSKEMTRKVTDPYFTTRETRKVGLGLPLLIQNAERTGGSVQIESKVKKGTKITATFILNHIDRPVLGDIPGAVLLTSTANPSVTLKYKHIKNGKSYLYHSSEVREVLGDTPQNDLRIYQYLLEMITENLKDIHVELTS